MRVLLSTYESHGDVEPMVGLRVLLRALGAEVRVCAPPDKDFAELLARAAGAGRPAGAPAGNRGDAAVGGGPAQARGRVGRRAVRHGRRGGRGMCDALVATGVMPAGVWR
jgi:vancomycin aglycone glucosyltransferase